MASPPPPSTDRRSNSRYVGASRNAERLSLGYSAQSGTIQVVSTEGYCSSIAGVTGNLTSPITVTFPPAAGGGATFHHKDSEFLFECAVDTANTDRRYPHFLLAIAQFVVMSFNQLEVDLDSPSEKVNAVATCDRAVKVAAALIRDPTSSTRGVTLGAALNAASLDAIVGVLQGLVGAENTIESRFSTRDNSNKYIKIDFKVPKEIHVKVGLQDVLLFLDLIIYNANIAAAILAAKGGAAGGDQLKNLPAVLDNYISFRMAAIFSSGVVEVKAELSG